MLNAVQARASLLLMERTGWTHDRLGRELGYASGDMVSHVVADGSGKLYGTVAYRRLGRLCTAHGIYDCADDFGGPDCVTVPIGELPTDGSLLDELKDIVEGLGLASSAFDIDPRKALHALQRVYVGSLRAMQECRVSLGLIRQAPCEAARAA